tara:strand:- start:211 stop:591 length:381 start_codon:yes stop_codon:yes gene_type:complete
MQQQPTRSEVAAALVSLCDILLYVDLVAKDTEMSTKLKAIKNYADTLFSASDCMKIRETLRERPALLEALRASDMNTACNHLHREANDEGQLQYALKCAATVYPALKETDRTAFWDEAALICELAS